MSPPSWRRPHGPFVGGELPVRLRAWDGSEAGPAEAPLVELRSPDALRRLLWHPGELGAAQAYVTGELDVHGDLGSALTHAFAVGRERGVTGRPGPAAFAHGVRTLQGLGVLGDPFRRLSRRPGCAAGCTAPGATGGRSATTTTCRTSSTP